MLPTCSFIPIESDPSLCFSAMLIVDPLEVSASQVGVLVASQRKVRLPRSSMGPFDLPQYSQEGPPPHLVSTKSAKVLHDGDAEQRLNLLLVAAMVARRVANTQEQGGKVQGGQGERGEDVRK